jgi:hypothetical protein
VTFDSPATEPVAASLRMNDRLVAAVTRTDRSAQRRQLRGISVEVAADQEAPVIDALEVATAAAL